MNASAESILRAFDGFAVRAVEESDLQEAVARILRGSRVEFDEQVQLAPGERIDFMCGSVGLELKTKGGVSPLLRQLHRYAAHERVSALIVVTTRRALAALPRAIGEKPLFSVGVGAL